MFRIPTFLSCIYFMLQPVFIRADASKSGKTKCDALIKRNVIFSSKTKCNKIKTHSTKEVDLKPIIKSTSSLYIKFKLHILISVK